MFKGENVGEMSEGPAAKLLDGEHLQARLERVWNALCLPEGQRLDMAIKYSSHKYRDHLREVGIMMMMLTLRRVEHLAMEDACVFVLSGDHGMGAGCPVDPAEGTVVV